MRLASIGSAVSKNVLRVIGRRLFARGDQLGGRLVDLLVQRIVEMVRLQEARHAVVRLVVDEHGAQQRLLGLKVVGGGAEGARSGARSDLQPYPALSCRVLSRRADARVMPLRPESARGRPSPRASFLAVLNPTRTCGEYNGLCYLDALLGVNSYHDVRPVDRGSLVLKLTDVNTRKSAGTDFRDKDKNTNTYSIIATSEPANGPRSSFLSNLRICGQAVHH